MSASLRLRNCRTQCAGFTIVELLVVIAILALLMAIAVPALRGVQQRNRKMMEANNIRQIHLAWNLYANHNRDAALPGYLDHEKVGGANVHEAWRVRYEYPVPPDPSQPTDLEIPHEIAAPWTWRLLPYVDHNIETIWRYRDVASTNLSSLVAMAGPGNVDALMLEIAEEPAFGYNAYHVGGWWEMTTPEGGGDPMPRAKFSDAASVNGGAPVNVISRTLPSIRRASEIIAFCTAVEYETAGFDLRRPDDDHPGSHVVTPGFLADVAQWVSPAGALQTNPPSTRPGSIETFVSPAYVPFGRYNGLVVLVNADGSIETTMPSEVHSQTRWIDNATAFDFTFQP